MKKAVLLLAFSIATISLANSLPKKAVGEYYAEVQDYEFKKENNKKMRASGFDIALILRESSVTYHCGKLHFEGTYQSIVANGNEIDVKLKMGTSVEVAFDMNVMIDTKEGSILISGMESVPSTELWRSDVIEKKNKGGFGRL
ncbi:hypothetical protein K6119_12440 [Paracrocinitomix mangrovi]|uniref:hypothetical protein n=1 Tax=Paracrocinitomix mangrovi TaxID=2862509 RepID=UPI001C8F0F5D|nr:hypothetical protein [Paracrocinitomix mangrovi]UKN00541.1 hypothetical protein K6119_12440 [Paracrocinitomix mangrovi]